MRWPADRDGEERLSDRFGTWFLRVLWPIFGLGSVPGFLVVLAGSSRSTWPAWKLIFFGVVVLAGFPAFYALVCRPLRWVWAGPDALRVSDGRSEARVPYSEIAEVRAYWWARDVVHVVLRAPSPVGRRFVLIPRFRMSRRGDHPVVARLRERAGLGPRP